MVLIFPSVDFFNPIASIMSSGMIDQANFEFLSLASINTALLILSENESRMKLVILLNELHSVQSSQSKMRKLKSFVDFSFYISSS